MHTNHEPATPGLYPTRRAIADEIERLIVMLDAFDGDADLEPSLGSLERHPGLGFGGGDQRTWSAGNRLDLEDEHDGREFDEDLEPAGDEDDEPSLGLPLNVHIGDLRLANGDIVEHDTFSQAPWARGCDDDRESEHDGREPESDCDDHERTAKPANA